MVSQIKLKDPTSSQIFQPTNACQSHLTFIYAVKISMQNAVFYNKICNVALINHTLSLTKCIMLCIYNYLAKKLLFCQTLICELKQYQIQCSSILSTRTQYGASVQLYCKALIRIWFFLILISQAYSTTLIHYHWFCFHSLFFQNRRSNGVVPLLCVSRAKLIECLSLPLVIEYSTCS